VTDRWRVLATATALPALATLADLALPATPIVAGATAGLLLALAALVVHRATSLDALRVGGGLVVAGALAGGIVTLVPVLLAALGLETAELSNPNVLAPVAVAAIAAVHAAR
jgi:hypothetical protein